MNSSPYSSFPRSFDCPYEFITSVEFAVRNDFRFPEDIGKYGTTESERKFQYFRLKYSVLKTLLSKNYELLPKYYGEQTHFIRKSLAFRSSVVAGDGWFAIGNSAGFTNPLISPGINAGLGSAVLAATCTAKILKEKGSVSRAAISRSVEEYQAYSHDFMMPRLHKLNRMWYNVFRDHRLFEAVERCIWALGVENIKTHYDAGYTRDEEMWLVGAGGDDFQDFCTRVLSVIDGPCDGVRVPGEQVACIQAICRQTLKERKERYPDNKWGRHIRNYDDSLCPAAGKTDRDGDNEFLAVQCKACQNWTPSFAKGCPMCGLRF
jgi:hypothetical protein